MLRTPKLLLVVLSLSLFAFAGSWKAGVVEGQSGAPSTVDPLILKALQWRSIGPARGGRSIAAAGVKGRPKEAYFGAVGGGLWKTTDGGENWTPSTDGQIKSSSVGAVAVAESDPNIVFIGMGEACIRGNIMPGDGVYKSADAGKSWTHVGFSESQAISKIRIHPTNPEIVFVASFGKYGAPSEQRGVFKSIDGGKTWQRKLFRDAQSGAVDIAVDRKNPNVLFAALWEAYRVEYQMSSGGPGSGLFKSVDGGETWTDITRNPGLPAGVVGKIGVSVSGADSNRVYALVENENGGLFVIGRCRRELEARERQPQHSPARVLLHPRRRGSRQPRHRVHAQRCPLQIHRRRQDVGDVGRFAQRSPRSLDRSGRSEASRAGERRRRRGVNRRRSGLDGAGFRDAAVLPCGHDEARALSRLRRAAGRQHGMRAERHRTGRRKRRRRGTRRAAGALQSGRLGARLRRTRSEGSRHFLRGRKQRIVSHAFRIAAPASCGRSIRTRGCSRANPRARSSSDGSGRIQSSSRPRIRTCSTRRRSTSGRRRMAARVGTRSARTSRGTIRRRWALRVARSRKT